MYFAVCARGEGGGLCIGVVVVCMMLNPITLLLLVCSKHYTTTNKALVHIEQQSSSIMGEEEEVCCIGKKTAVRNRDLLLRCCVPLSVCAQNYHMYRTHTAAAAKPLYLLPTPDPLCLHAWILRSQRITTVNKLRFYKTATTGKQHRII